MTITADYVLQGVNPQQIATAPFDVQVVETANDSGVPFTAAEVKQMESGGSQVLGYFSLGEAENYRDYFSSLSQSIVGPQDPNWPGNYEVAFWTPEWKAVAEQAIDKMVAAGYKDIYFDVVDEYQQAWAQSHDPHAEQDMVNLVESLKAYATSKDPNFKVWVNGAEELLSHSDYVNTIDGMFKENVFYTDSGQKQPASETQYTLQNLDKAIAAGKPVVAVEYVSGAANIADVHAQAAHDNVGSYVGHLDLNGIDYDGVLPGQTVHPIGTSGSTTTTGSTTTIGTTTTPGGSQTTGTGSDTTGTTTGGSPSPGGTSGSTGGTSTSAGGTSTSAGDTSTSTSGTSTTGSPDSTAGGWHHDWQHTSGHSTTSGTSTASSPDSISGGW